MEFEKYQKIVKLGREQTRGIENGVCHIFPKIDGTNSSVWLSVEGDRVCAGSRNRELSEDNDNAGFYKFIQKHSGIKRFLKDNPNKRLYGEFLTPHTFRGYKDNAWKKFYVFDVIEYNTKENIDKYIPYDDYIEKLSFYGIDFIPRIDVVTNLPINMFQEYLPRATFLVDDSCGAEYGEGVVVKNYDFINKFGNQIWAKIVSPHFGEKKGLKENQPDNEIIESKIVNKYCDGAFIEKEYSKIITQINGESNWSGKNIPQLLGIVYHEFLVEELPDIIKKFKNPIIDFKILQTSINQKIKEIKPELF